MENRGCTHNKKGGVPCGKLKLVDNYLKRCNYHNPMAANKCLHVEELLLGESVHLTVAQFHQLKTQGLISRWEDLCYGKCNTTFPEERRCKQHSDLLKKSCATKRCRNERSSDQEKLCTTCLGGGFPRAVEEFLEHPLVNWERDIRPYYLANKNSFNQDPGYIYMYRWLKSPSFKERLKVEVTLDNALVKIGKESEKFSRTEDGHWGKLASKYGYTLELCCSPLRVEGSVSLAEGLIHKILSNWRVCRSTINPSKVKYYSNPTQFVSSSSLKHTEGGKEEGWMKEWFYLGQKNTTALEDLFYIFRVISAIVQLLNDK